MEELILNAVINEQKNFFKVNYNFLNEWHHKIILHQLEQPQQFPMQELSVLMQMLHFSQNEAYSMKLHYIKLSNWRIMAKR